MEDPKITSSIPTPKKDAEMSIIKMMLIASLQLGMSTVQGCFSLIVVPYETDSKDFFASRDLIRIRTV